MHFNDIKCLLRNICNSDRLGFYNASRGIKPN